ncbi:MAG TPA: 50S ribosomal protein L21 [Candidatus Paceibacterota bacterium]
MHAVFTTGGKQYRVKKGNKVKIEKLSGDHKEGDKLTFDQVLLVEEPFILGKPLIEGASVTATLKKISRYKTVDVVKYKQKSRYFKRYGHRQPYFEIEIDSIK